MKLEQHELPSARNLLVACQALGKAPQSGLNEMEEAVRLARWVQQAIDAAEKSESSNSESES